jgi:DNA invertase Pin-like site-specific DNA recombinase
MIKSVGYIRVSTDKQDFERQRDEITQYAAKNDFVISQFFEDKQSGSDYKDRKGFQELLQYLEDHPDMQVIIFDEISRMGRDTAEQVIAYKQLSHKGIRIYTRGKGEFGKNKEDTLLFTVLSAIAEYEKQTIVDRTSSGRRRVVREGATQISIKPYGYNLLLTERKDRIVFKRQFVELNPEEAEVVRQIFRIVDDGGSVSDVIRHLKKHGIRTPEGNEIWGSSTVLRILHNSMYYGKWQFGKFYKNRKTKYSLSKRSASDLIIVDVPPIIPQDMFDRAQTKIKASREKFNPKNLKDTYLLKGIGICACGRMLQCYRETKSQKRIYRCPERNIEGIAQKTCPVNSLHADFVENILLTELKKNVENPDFFQEIKLQELQARQSNADLFQTKISRLTQEIEEGNSLVKAYYEKAAKAELQNAGKSDILENLADSKLQEVEEKRQELKKLQDGLKKDENNALDLNVLENIQAALKDIGKQEVLAVSYSDQSRRLEFFRKYVNEVRVTILEQDTAALRETLGKLRQQKLFARGNVAIKELYRTCFTREHTLKTRAINVINCKVEFTGNLTVNIKFPYFHDKPEMAVSYVVEGMGR